MTNWFFVEKTGYSKIDPRTGKINLRATDGNYISCFIQEGFDVEVVSQGKLLPVIENDEGLFIVIGVSIPELSS